MGQADDIKMLIPRHEHSVSYKADGYARVTGKHGVGMVVPGPGMLLASAGIATAYSCISPVVLIVGQINSSNCIFNLLERPISGLIYRGR